MAYVPIGDNLITDGDNGTFESNSASWGDLGDFEYRVVSRSNEQRYEGDYSCKVLSIEVSPETLYPPYAHKLIVLKSIQLEAGKRYIVKAKVRVDASNPAATDDVRVSIAPYNSSPFPSGHGSINTKISECKTDWKDIVQVFSYSPGPTPGPISFWIGLITKSGSGSPYGDIIEDGIIYIDQVELYEYVEEVLGCTDPLANNYDPNATVDDGSCIFNYGCTDPNATNYDPSAVIDDGSCTYAPVNTGYKAWATLEEYHIASGLPTGQTKPNAESDPDYVPPVHDPITCPLP